eukprot:gene5072-7078_t
MLLSLKSINSLFHFRAITSFRGLQRLLSSSNSSNPVPSYYLLEYKYVKDMALKRDPYRKDHLMLANSTPTIVAAGAYTPDLDGAMFIFKSKSKADIDEFVAKDPYVIAGLVSEMRIKEWSVPVGKIE